MALSEYRRKRNFQVTSEPPGGRVKSHQGLLFVIQKHAASHLHYDFRLEISGVLKSWAVPKGPSLDPVHKRLAMHVEDHPLEYGDFEGIIPEGEYGGGTVMLWDKGTWEPLEEDEEKAYRNGSLKFVLHGKKLQGKWMLVRKGGKRADESERHWFLFKERDKFSRPGSDIEDEEPLSVTTGRGLDEIAETADRVWGRNGEMNKRERAKAKLSRNGRVKPVKAVKKRQMATAVQLKRRLAKALKSIGGKKSSFPSAAKVELATLAKKTPEGDDWMHEIKFDGYRMLCHVRNRKTRFISRNGKDWTKKFTHLVKHIAALPIANGILDGEIVIVDEAGRTSFQALQNAFQEGGAAPFVYYVFDLLYLNETDIRQVAIEERKAVLREIIPTDEESSIKYSDHVKGNGPQFFAEAARLKLEGIISKRLGRPYVEGRGIDWLKVKCSKREEFVIGGYTKPSGGRKYFGALAVGFHNKAGELICAGRVGTGFDERTLKNLYEKFQSLVQDKSPFKNLRGRTGQARGVTWLRPTLVAQIEFSNWTSEKQLRHPSFQGLREDKPAKNVVRDEAITETILESAAAAKQQRKSQKMKTGKKRSASSADANTTIAGIKLSHPDKLLYPDDGVTKVDLCHYYEEVATWMLPHVENRLLSLVRCPSGSGGKCFFQKHPGDGTSDVFKRFKVKESTKVEEHLALYNLSGLIALAQMGVLEIHIWGSQADKYEKPDRLVFDLDPDPSVSWPEVVTAAKEMRLLFEELELQPFLKTTGSKGLHIVVPIQRRITWADAKTFCRAVADFMVAAAPDRYIAKMSKVARKNKIFVDYLRNDEGATAIAPYSTRNRPGATVSVPISWDELTGRLKSDHFHIYNVPTRLAKIKKDPWRDIRTTKQSITALMLKRLKTLR